MVDDQERACGVCFHKLIRLEHGDGSISWTHSLVKEDEHEPVPVPEDQVPTIYHCDFCRETPADYLLTVEMFDHTHFLSATDQVLMNSGHSWATCWACTALIESDQWWGLMRRVIRSYEATAGIGKIGTETRAYLWNQLLSVRAHVVGHVQERKP